MDPTNSLSVYKCHPVSEVNSNQFMSVYSIDVRHDSYISSNQCGDCQKCSRISVDKSRQCQRKLCIKSSEKLESRNKGCWTVLRRKFYLISRIIFSRQMQDIEEGDDNKLPQIRPPLQVDVENDQDKSKPAYSDIIVEDMTQEVLDVKSMLFKLKTILLEAGTANPSQPTNLYANIVNAEADILTSTAVNCLNMETASEVIKDIPGNAANKAVEENQDLKRQLVFLQQQLVEKDRRIKKLESLVAGGGNTSPLSITKQRKNSASQTDRPRPVSWGVSGIARPNVIKGDFVSFQIGKM